LLDMTSAQLWPSQTQGSVSAAITPSPVVLWRSHSEQITRYCDAIRRYRKLLLAIIDATIQRVTFCASRPGNN
jgi:hypothetical protein